VGSEYATRCGFYADLPPQSRRVIHIHLVAKSVGRASIQIACVAGTFGDATELSIPVYEAKAQQAFVIRRELHDNPDAILQTVTIPPDIVPTVGNIEVRLVSRLLTF
jgi:hypothetical protein